METSPATGPVAAAPAAPACRGRSGWRGPIKLALLGAGASMLALSVGFVVFLGSIEQAEHDPEGRTDAIVALTGGAQRIEDAIELLARGYGHRLLITGVNERTSRAQIKRLTPDQRELVECCVDLDYRARNTVGNAAEIRRWALDNGFTSLIVVTSNYHLPRTLAELDEALPGIRKVPYAVVVSPRPGEGLSGQLGRARLLVAEYLKYLAVSVRMRLAGGRPADTAPAGPPVRRSVAKADPPR